MHLLRATLLVLLCVHCAHAADFRKATWGMSANQVKQTETAKLVTHTNHKLTYATRLLGQEVTLMYIFVDNKLVRTRYDNAENHINNIEYFRYYDKLVSTLKDKYGPPTEEFTYYENDQLKDRPGTWATALGAGRIAKFTVWELGETQIDAGLYGRNSKVTCGVEYVSTELIQLEVERKRKQAHDAL